MLAPLPCTDAISHQNCVACGHREPLLLPGVAKREKQVSGSYQVTYDCPRIIILGLHAWVHALIAATGDIQLFSMSSLESVLIVSAGIMCMRLMAIKVQDSRV